jgi:hypothetical protein
MHLPAAAAVAAAGVAVVVAAAAGVAASAAVVVAALVLVAAAVAVLRRSVPLHHDQVVEVALVPALAAAEPAPDQCRVLGQLLVAAVADLPSVPARALAAVPRQVAVVPPSAGNPVSAIDRASVGNLESVHDPAQELALVIDQRHFPDLVAAFRVQRLGQGRRCQSGVTISRGSCNKRVAKTAASGNRIDKISQTPVVKTGRTITTITMGITAIGTTAAGMETPELGGIICGKTTRPRRFWASPRGA